MSTLLRVAGLNASYGPLQVLKSVNLHVNEGEIVTLLGANGAGKTTTLKAICGLMNNCSGTIEYDGQNITDTDTERIVAAGVVQVPEGRQVFEQLSVRDNLLLGAYLRLRRNESSQVQRDIERVTEVFPVLTERMSQRAGTLSGGEQQMLAIARALMGNPGMLLLDEPSMGLAPMLVSNILDTIADLRDRHGTTVLLVEQNAAAALRIADRGYVLETGRIVLEGTATELMRDREVQRAYLGKDYEEV